MRRRRRTNNRNRTSGYGEYRKRREPPSILESPSSSLGPRPSLARRRPGRLGPKVLASRPQSRAEPRPAVVSTAAPCERMASAALIWECVKAPRGREERRVGQS